MATDQARASIVAVVCPDCRQEAFDPEEDLWRRFLHEVYSGPDRATYAIQLAAELVLAERCRQRQAAEEEIRPLRKALERTKELIGEAKELLA